ncbi:NIPSNAP family protein [Terrimonas alba]|uniref:NIPSNAP family protein n=1 Tax=Terrimonas alba TaxID=3349636 RepID=UPI0035F368E9
MKKISLLFAGLFLLQQLCWSQTRKDGREFYQLTIYHYTKDDQEKKLDAYLENALLPALHRMKIKQVGVFKAISNDTSTAKSLYVLLPLSSLDMIGKIETGLQADKDYQAKGSEYINAVYTDPFFTRMETILAKAFPWAPQLQLPQLKAAKKDRVYELRSYESASEKIFKNKVQMFNEGGEIALFKRLGFNAIFYSEVIAGSKMPNLMYMTSFENMADRDAHWKSFSNDAEWKKISSMPEYQHNVSHIDIIFLRPAEYSDL